MTQASITHATFTIERRYDASPARVFRAWSQAELKLRWFACHADWAPTGYELDFRVGGSERVRTGPAGGTVHAYDARFHQISTDERIVYAYDMRLDETLISVSLASVEFKPAAGGTRLVFTEQGAFLDGYTDRREREHGTALGLDNLQALMRSTSSQP
jgi:uncharacterized protein YndB with AHSA1/START domain